MRGRQTTKYLLLAAMLLMALLSPQDADAIDLHLNYELRYTGFTGNPNPSGEVDESADFRISFSGGNIQDNDQTGTDRYYYATIRPGEKVKAFVGDIVLTKCPDDVREYGFFCRVSINSDDPKEANTETGVASWDTYVKRDTSTGMNPSASVTYTVGKDIRKFRVFIDLYKRLADDTHGDSPRSTVIIEYTVEHDEQASTGDGDGENLDDEEEEEEDDEEYWDEEDSDAWNWGGVWIYVIPIGVIVALGGGAAVAAGKKKKKRTSQPHRMAATRWRCTRTSAIR